MLQIRPEPMRLQRGPDIVLMHAVALMRPLLRLIRIQRPRVVLEALRVSRVVEEEDRAVAVGEAGDAVLGAGVEALFADLVQEGMGDDLPELRVVGAEEDGNSGRYVVEGRRDVEEGGFGDLDDFGIGHGGFR